jgi:hypothetical protein
VVEALHKLSNGDPETFLNFWENHKGDFRGAQKTQLQSFADMATKRMATEKSDAAAMSNYARTNNHQVMLDYVTKRMETENDPTQQSKLSTMANELRGRIFKGGGGGTSVGGGYTVQDLKDAKDEFYQARIEADKQLKAGYPLTDGMKSRIENASDSYSKILDASLKSSTGVPKKTAEAERTLAHEAPSDYTAKSDALVVKGEGQRSGFGLDKAGQSAFERSLVGMPTAQKISAMTNRVADLNDAGDKVHSPGLLAEVHNNLGMTTSKLDVAYAESQNPDKEDKGKAKQAQSAIYDQYKVWALAQKKDDSTFKVEDPADFGSIIRVSKSGLEAAKALGMVDDNNNWKKGVPDILGSSLDTGGTGTGADTKKVFSAYEPPRWDATTASFRGDKEDVATVNSTVDSVRARGRVAGDKFYGVSGTDGELYSVASGHYDPSILKRAGPNASGGSAESRAFQHGTIAGAEGTSPRKPDLYGGGGAGLAPASLGAEKAQADIPESVATQDNPNGPKPTLASLTAENVDDHYSALSDSARSYLSAGADVPDLPAWHPSDDEKDKTPDWESMFPFSTGQQNIGNVPGSGDQPIVSGGGGGGGLRQ